MIDPLEAYLARQPIFDTNYQVQGYELLYRDAQNQTKAEFVDGDQATRCLLSDAITLFGLPNLTNSKPAFINFTENLILSGYVYLTRPEEVVIELLENITVSDRMIEKLREMKERGYIIALDDYDQNSRFDPIMPYIDIIKVDLRLTTPEQQGEIARTWGGKTGVRLLAEKVETYEEFDRVKNLGYELFQGYFFERPVTLHKDLPAMSLSSYARILSILQADDVDFQKCAEIIHSDVVLTYRLMQRIQATQYYHRSPISSIQRALATMGAAEMRRWVLLIMARVNNTTFGDDELVREAYLRGCFARRLMTVCRPEEDSENGFLLGMFSLLDKILGTDLGSIAREVALPSEVEAALLGKEHNFYYRLLQFIVAYEMRSPQSALPDIGLTVPISQVADLYMQSVAETDYIFLTTP